MTPVKIQRLRQDAVLPCRASNGAAGYDLCACLDSPLLLSPGETVLVPTGLALALPSGCAAFIYARSGLGIRHGLVPANCVGVVDSDYRGEVMVGLKNTSAAAYTVQPQERIAQMVIAPVLTPEFNEVEELPETTRGGGGFGSTGKNNKNGNDI